MNDNPPEIPSRRLQLRDGDTTTGGLVVGFDRHEASTAALKSAATLATRLSIVVHVVHAVDLRDHPIDPDGPDWEEEARATLRDEERTVQDVLDPFGCAWTYQAGRHDPADLLAAVAVETKAMMIVVGSHGQGMGNALSHLFEGSIEHRLLSERPPCGVLVVPSPSTRP